MDPSGPCCFVGQRADLPAVEEALRSTESLGSMERRFGISRGSLRKHREKCMGMPGASRMRANGMPTAAGTGEPSATEAVPSGMPAGTDPKGPRRPPAPRLSAAAVAVTEDAQVRFVCDLIDTNQFHFRFTLDWLGQAWSLSHEEVRSRYQAALARCSADRQVHMAQLEVSLAALEAQERAAMQEHRRLRKKEPSSARNYLGLAIKARTEYAELAGLRRLRIEASLDIWTRPEFVMAVDRFTETAVDVLVPGEDATLQALARRVAAKAGVPDVDPAVVAAALAVAGEDLAQRIADLLRAPGGEAPPPALPPAPITAPAEPLDAAAE